MKGGVDTERMFMQIDQKRYWLILDAGDATLGLSPEVCEPCSTSRPMQYEQSLQPVALSMVMLLRPACQPQS